jgi:hypothetical protein
MGARLPPLIGAALVAGAEALGAAGLAAGLGTTVAGVSVATIAGYAIATVATVGAQFAFSRLQAKRGKKGDLQITAVTVKQPIPVRTRAYGRVRLSGALFYEDALPVIYQPLLLGVVHCEGPINRFVNLILNDTFAGVSGAVGADVSAVNLALPWVYYITLESKRGTDTQSASSILSTYRGLTDFNLKGLAYTVMLCAQPPRPDKYFQYYYPSGIPTVSVIIEAALIFDPRDSATRWTANPALIIRDYLIVAKVDASGRSIPRGMGLTSSRINNASFSTFANMCDQVYQSKYSLNPVDGSASAIPRNEPRYECHAPYNMDEAPASVLNKMLGTCDGTLYTDSDGLICIRGGAYDPPTVLINDDMILHCDLSKGSGKYELFNRLKISFTAENMLYNVVEGHPWDDDEDILSNGVLSDDLFVPYVHSYSQARRLAKIAMAKGNPEWVYTSLTCTLAALNVLGEEFVHVTHSLPGIDGPFLIHSVKIMPESGTVELSLSSIDPACYDWNPAVEDAIPPSPQGGTG